jgi:hypothetical protein
MNARERRMAGALFPFVPGGWLHLDVLGDDPPGMPDAVWPAVEKALGLGAKAVRTFTAAQLAMAALAALSAGALLGGLGVYVSVRGSRTTPPITTIAAEPERRAEGAPTATASAVAASSAPTEANSVAAPTTAPPPPRVDPDETLLLEQARMALRNRPLTDKDIDAALFHLSRHERRFTTSRFAPERDKLRADALLARSQMTPSAKGRGPIFQ